MSTKQFHVWPPGDCLTEQQELFEGGGVDPVAVVLRAIAQSAAEMAETLPEHECTLWNLVERIEFELDRMLSMAPLAAH